MAVRQRYVQILVYRDCQAVGIQFNGYSKLIAQVIEFPHFQLYTMFYVEQFKLIKESEIILYNCYGDCDVD